MIKSLLRYYWKQARHFDAILVAAVVLLTIGGILMIYSASVWQALASNKPPTYYLERQLVALVPALIASLILSVFPLHILRRFAWLGYLLACVLVLTVLIVGRHISGATRWFSIGGFTFQPSEIAKLAVVLVLATWFSQQPDRARSFRSGLLFALIIIVIPAGLVELEPDLGTSLVVAAGGLGVLFAAGLAKRYLVGVIPLVFVVVFVLANSASYRVHRLEAFTNPLSTKNSTSVTYQVVQGLIALGSG
ncbi:MAG: FtsW/RodA/SpoVE family cell cycle protein, partial [Chloroflexi bacterium]|nr:FtsW/RodA/SpoVE family cell cycle protein [Chloroflexota bacterium]